MRDPHGLIEISGIQRSSRQPERFGPAFGDSFKSSHGPLAGARIIAFAHTHELPNNRVHNMNDEHGKDERQDIEEDSRRIRILYRPSGELFKPFGDFSQS